MMNDRSLVLSVMLVLRVAPRRCERGRVVLCVCPVHPCLATWIPGVSRRVLVKSSLAYTCLFHPSFSLTHSIELPAHGPAPGSSGPQQAHARRRYAWSGRVTVVIETVSSEIHMYKIIITRCNVIFYSLHFSYTFPGDLLFI